MTERRLEFLVFLSMIFAIAIAFSPASDAAGLGYAPAASVINTPTYAQIKTVMTKIGTLPTDTMAKVYPSVANGVKLASGVTGAVASSVYAGSAAVASKMYIPLKSGAQIAIDMVANIPNPSLVASALAVAKSPYLWAAVTVGSALYHWYDSAGVSPDGHGGLLTLPSLTVSPNLLWSEGSSFGFQSAQTACEHICTINGASVALCQAVRENVDICNFFHDVGHTSMRTRLQLYSIPGTTCVSGYFYANGVCNRNSSALPVPISDTDALSKLSNLAPINPASVLQDLDKAGQTPDVDPPVLTVPSSIPISTTTTHNPNGSTTDDNVVAKPTVEGDTVKVSLETTRTERDQAGVVTGTTTKNESPLVATNEGQSIAVTAPQDVKVDLTPVVSAIDAAKMQAHADAIAAPGLEAAAIMNSPPSVLPVQPTLTLDTDAFFPFLNTVNPFNWDVHSFLPTLPGAVVCGYEIHRVIFGKNFDFAPCVPLQPLRAVLAWAFSVLTLWAAFMIIFRSPM
jgi:hypothetical protein